MPNDFIIISLEYIPLAMNCLVWEVLKLIDK